MPELKVKEENVSDLPALADETNFRVIDESGDDSDAQSVKTEHTGGKSKDVTAQEPEKNHPYRYDIQNLKLSDDLKEKVLLTFCQKYRYKKNCVNSENANIIYNFTELVNRSLLKN